MPYKFNAAYRHKFRKKRYRVKNWTGYNESLRKRGDVTVWFAADVSGLWAAPRRKSRGGQAKYSEMAITMCLTLSVVYKLPRRQTQGLVRGLARLMGLGVETVTISNATFLIIRNHSGEPSDLSRTI